LRDRRLLYAAIAEPVEPDLNAVRATLRKTIAAEFAALITAALTRGQLPEQDVTLATAALLGILNEGLLGPNAPDAAGRERDVVQSLTLVALRALGVADARARGLVVQTALPAD